MFNVERYMERGRRGWQELRFTLRLESMYLKLQYAETEDTRNDYIGYVLMEA